MIRIISEMNSITELKKINNTLANLRLANKKKNLEFLRYFEENKEKIYYDQTLYLRNFIQGLEKNGITHLTTEVFNLYEKIKIKLGDFLLKNLSGLELGNDSAEYSEDRFAHKIIDRIAPKSPSEVLENLPVRPKLDNLDIVPFDFLFYIKKIFESLKKYLLYYLYSILNFIRNYIKACPEIRSLILHKVILILILVKLIFLLEKDLKFIGNNIINSIKNKDVFKDVFKKRLQGELKKTLKEIILAIILFFIAIFSLKFILPAITLFILVICDVYYDLYLDFMRGFP